MTDATAVAAVATNFGRDFGANLAAIATYIGAARDRRVSLLALPEACLGGYLSVLGRGRDGEFDESPDSLPPVMDIDGPELKHVADLARDMTIVVGFCEADGGQRYNSAAIVTGDGVLGVYRKVHQPLGENLYYAPGDELRAFETPVGRVGALICYDKTFPEAARALALDGAQVITCISAWPASRTATASDLAQDRWTHRFNIFDQARALENQVVWVASNQAGTFGRLRFVGNAKVVGPGGDVLATTGAGGGLAVAEIDIAQALETARRSMFYLSDRRPEAYRATGTPGERAAAGTPQSAGPSVEQPAHA
jgi:N-carbamoylputrescine amidase